MFLPAGKNLVLGSQSPRRKALLEQMAYTFRCLSADVDESHGPELSGAQIAEFLAEKKALALKNQLNKDEILLTSDTVVWSKGESLAKAQNAEEARSMLQALSGGSHEVITGVCLLSAEKTELFHDVVKVKFAELSPAIIEYYIKNYRPFDKAGAYGIQEWIGMVGIEKIEGSFFTVMGLPTQAVFQKLLNW